MKSLRLIFLFTMMLGVSFSTEAQFFKKLKKALKEAGSESSSENTDKKDEAAEEKVRTLNEWHRSHEGKVVFYNKEIIYGEIDSSDDGEVKMITERVIGGSGPFSFRAYLGKPVKKFDGCGDCTEAEIRYSIGDVSVSTRDLRRDYDKWYYRGAGVIGSYYDTKNYSVGASLTAGPGRYYDILYMMPEDAYRMLLSKVKDKLKKGANLTLKVEVLGTTDNFKEPKDVVLASGEITLKVTEESGNLQSLHCRCGKPGLKDEKIVKEVKDAFEYQFNDVKKVHKVVLLDREFTQNYDNSYPVKNVTSKGMWANIIYEKEGDGIFMMIKHYIFFKKIGTGFSDKATIGKHKFYLPVSPTCALF